MSDRCDGCAFQDSIHCPECMEGGFCFFKPLVTLRLTTDTRKPYDPPKAEIICITNGDRIRAMTNESLADFLTEFESGEICKGDPRCEADLEEDRLIPIERCRECALAWLKAPYVPKEAADA